LVRSGSGTARPRLFIPSLLGDTLGKHAVTRKPTIMKGNLITGMASIVLGFFLMIPLAMLFDARDWPLFHSWGLAHGSFLIAWPALVAVSFGLIRIVTRVMQARALRD
jgi:hypothetical protein